MTKTTPPQNTLNGSTKFFCFIFSIYFLALSVMPSSDVHKLNPPAGNTNRDFTEITDGLQAGETVVISGAYLLHGELVFKKGANLMTGHDTGGGGGHEGH